MAPQFYTVRGYQLLEQKKKNKLIIIASHNKEDISLLSDTVISVSNGRFQRK